MQSLRAFRRAVDCSWAEFASKMLRRGAVHRSESTLLTVYQPRSATKEGKKCRFERTGLESKKLEASKSIWLERARAGSSGLERIGLESCGLEVSKSIWLERARAKGQETWNCSDPSDQSARARSSQMDFQRVVVGGGRCEKWIDTKILFIFYYILLFYYINGVYTPMTQRVGGFAFYIMLL